jgi:hypothetical protein
VLCFLFCFKFFSQFLWTVLFWFLLWYSLTFIKQWWTAVQPKSSKQQITHISKYWTIEQKKKTTTICVGHHYTQTNTNNVNKTRALLQTTGSKKEPNIVADITTWKKWNYELKHLSLPRLLQDLTVYIWVTRRVSYKKQELRIIHKRLSSPLGFLVGSVLLIQLCQYLKINDLSQHFYNIVIN